MVNVIATNRAWYEYLAKRLKEKTNTGFVLITAKEELSYETLQKIKPRYVFLPHWSYIVPADVYQNFECVVFHMTDVPFGRGGSPLQNLISRGIYETKISALRCEAGIDAGPVYTKRQLSLYGTAEEIYMRAAQVIEDMICDIIAQNISPAAQEGEVVCFPRRTPADSNIKDLEDLNKVYDFIRMLDAEGYPKAYMETDNFRLEFSRASLKHDEIMADVIIKRKA